MTTATITFDTKLPPGWRYCSADGTQKCPALSCLNLNDGKGRIFGCGLFGVAMGKLPPGEWPRRLRQCMKAEVAK